MPASRGGRRTRPLLAGGRGFGLLLVVPLLACALPAAAAEEGEAEEPPHSVLDDFARLWDLVALRQASRNAQPEEAPPIRRACQYGLGDSTAAVSEFLLVVGAVEALEVHDAGAASGAPAQAQELLAELQARYGGRVLAVDGPPPESLCDLVLFSVDAPRFSLDRVRPRLSDFAVVAWVAGSCLSEEGDEASPACNLQGTLWEKSALIRRGYCLRGACMSRVPAKLLLDPNVLSLDCPRFTSANGSDASVAEFGQDWYLYWNFLRGAGDEGERVARSGSGEPGGVYVDVGASMPFDYSNTAILDRCLGWRGVCVEPNPHILAFLHAYRSCEVFPNCVDEDGSQDKAFSSRDGHLAFTANCLSLDAILGRAGLRGKRIDVLSVDVEHGEMSVLSGLSLDQYDIRLIVVEVGQGVRWLEVDTVLLPHGYAKVAVLGRDVVYAKLDELAPSGSARWTFLAQKSVVLPDGWEDFHNRVLDDELKDEMRRERAAFYAGLRAA